ncbi:hypothetical protein ACFE04_010947 [Oxalis oulophora]
MEPCKCIGSGSQWSSDELLMKLQFCSDLFITLAYFAIPIELLFLVKKSASFPYKWALLQAGAFIVLCGASHLVNLWTFGIPSKNVAIVLTVTKILTGLVSLSMVFVLAKIIPQLLNLITYEEEPLLKPEHHGHGKSLA